MAFGLSEGSALATRAWLLLVVGALGGYTTFSTFALATLDLLADGGKSGTVLLNLLTGPAGILAAYLGVIFVRSLRDMGGTV